MQNEPTINELLEQLDKEMAWFYSDEFRLEEARERFLAVKKLAEQAEERLLNMKNEIEVLGE